MSLWGVVEAVSLVDVSRCKWCPVKGNLLFADDD